MNIDRMLETALDTYQMSGSEYLYKVYEQVGSIAFTALSAYMKAGFTRDEAFALVREQIKDMKLTLS
jgi:hypothetical protein